MVGYVLMQVKKIARQMTVQVGYLSNDWTSVSVTEKEIWAGGLLIYFSCCKSEAMREESWCNL